MSVETMAELFKLPNIVGVKDATGDLARVSLQRWKVGEEFIQLSGEDATALGFNAHGGHGCISVAANIAPALCAQMQEASLAGDYATALSIQDKLMPLHTALFVESNPAPAKFGASLLDICQEELRLPLVKVSEPTQALMRDAMTIAGIL
jgi:4-hydroxy-tetrahydrodipicolinate synthase